MGRLTTHVLDTSRGAPARGMRIELSREKDQRELAGATTNAEGRTDSPLLEGGALTAGTYRLVFHVGEYFRSRGEPDAGRFLEKVPVVFVVDDPEGKYHVPLLVSPWSYSTYRGS
ncbi:MAG: hydroxyisourate hydrolase [Spirochaetia bacterium]